MDLSRSAQLQGYYPKKKSEVGTIDSENRSIHVEKFEIDLGLQAPPNIAYF